MTGWNAIYRNLLDCTKSWKTVNTAPPTWQAIPECHLIALYNPLKDLYWSCRINEYSPTASPPPPPPPPPPTHHARLVISSNKTTHLQGSEDWMCGRRAPTKLVCAGCVKMYCLGRKNSVVKGWTFSTHIYMHTHTYTQYKELLCWCSAELPVANGHLTFILLIYCRRWMLSWSDPSLLAWLVCCDVNSACWHPNWL